MHEALSPLSSQTDLQSGPNTSSPQNISRFSRMTRAMVAGLLLGMTPALAESAEPLEKATETHAVSGTGALFIAGGGNLSPEIRNHFIELGGGKKAKVVIIPTASEDADQPEKIPSFYWEGLQGSVDSVDIVHTRNREVADADEEASRPLDQASAVWFTGGKQDRLGVYRDTNILQKIRRVLERGGVVGGTSAGAAIMSGGPMIVGGKTEPEMGVGLGFLPGAIVDQHFLVRSRGERLRKALQIHTDLVGFGIDEGTALIVKQGKFHVRGASTVSVYDKDGERRTLKAGEEIDVTALGMPSLFADNR